MTISDKLTQRINSNREIKTGIKPLQVTRAEWNEWVRYVFELTNEQPKQIKEIPKGYTIRGKKVVIND